MFTDYAIRVLMHAAFNPDRLVTIEETATAQSISRAHVKKVVMMLSRTGYLRGVRGRTGGFTLALPPEEIDLGELVRRTEPDFGIVECLRPGNRCVLTPGCGLPPILKRAVRAFLETLEGHSLGDIMRTPSPGT
jgi:Rrf2 family transcriptional regulator, nitric oxide-sensitive transcriptional repressor